MVALCWIVALTNTAGVIWIGFLKDWLLKD